VKRGGMTPSSARTVEIGKRASSKQPHRTSTAAFITPPPLHHHHHRLSTSQHCENLQRPTSHLSQLRIASITTTTTTMYPPPKLPRSSAPANLRQAPHHLVRLRRRPANPATRRTTGHNFVRPESSNQRRASIDAIDISAPLLQRPPAHRRHSDTGAIQHERRRHGSRARSTLSTRPGAARATTPTAAATATLRQRSDPAASPGVSRAAARAP
jgi:hypothetical protein